MIITGRKIDKRIGRRRKSAVVVRTNSNFLENPPIRFVKSKHHIGVTITITTTIKCQGDKVEKEKNIWTGSDDQNKTTEES